MRERRTGLRFESIPRINPSPHFTTVYCSTVRTSDQLRSSSSFKIELPAPTSSLTTFLHKPPRAPIRDHTHRVTSSSTTDSSFASMSDELLFRMTRIPSMATANGLKTGDRRLDCFLVCRFSASHRAMEKTDTGEKRRQ